MSRKDAHAFAASLAATLMVSIVVFQAGDGTRPTKRRPRVGVDGLRKAAMAVLLLCDFGIYRLLGAKALMPNT